MRAAGLAVLTALLVTALGCDQIFGIGHTQAWDAHGVIDAADYATSITWQTQAAINGPITFDPIDNLTVQLASLDPGGGIDAPFSYPPTTVAVDSTGNFLVPYSLGFEPYRVMFTAPDGVPTEIQTKLHGFHFTFPLYGRQTRDPVSTGATFQGQATSATGVPAYNHVRLVTANLWAVTGSDQGIGAGNGSIGIGYDSGTMTSLSGPLGVPSAAAGDIEVALFMTDTAANAGYAVFAADGLGAVAQATWQDPMDTMITSIYMNDAACNSGQMRIANALAGYTLDPTKLKNRWAGVVPSAQMPSFVQETYAKASPPVLLPLSESNDAPFAFQDPFVGGAAPQLMTAIYAGDFRQRAAGSGSVLLQTALQNVTLASPNTLANQALPDYNVGIAGATAPTTFGSTTFSSDGATVSIGAAAMLPLVFAADGNVDVCTVTLYRIANGTLSPAVRYIVTDTPVHAQTPIMVDANYLDTTSTFTFGIRCDLGRPLTGNDFSIVTYPYEQSSTFTATFTAQ